MNIVSHVLTDRFAAADPLRAWPVFLIVGLEVMESITHSSLESTQTIKMGIGICYGDKLKSVILTTWNIKCSLVKKIWAACHIS